MHEIVELIKGVAWPLAVIVLAIMFKQEMRALIGRLSKMKYKDIEAEFRQGLEEASMHVEAGVLEVSARPQLSEKGEAEQVLLQYEDLEGRLLKLAEIAPRAAILEAWLNVEIPLMQTALNGKEKGSRSITGAVRQLQAGGALPSEWAMAISSLYGLRTQAAHDANFEPTVSDAQRYVRMAVPIAAQLRQQS